ncbi:hypothetical protein Tco_1057913 [Tanacetum coccineum]|uniref:Uncharacterized protein n=1 Tax=Tanacetum coccineum TaxID=301880 RepID=A0ABQ5H6R5_9ASTR
MPGSDFEASEAAPHSPKQAPPSPAYAPDSPEYATPSNDDLEPTEAQALPAPVLPAPQVLDYSTDSKPIEDNPQETGLEDVPEEDPSKGEEEEEELPAPAASTAATPDPALPSEEEIEPFDEDESVRPHQILSLGTLADTVALVTSPPLLQPLPSSPTHRDPIPESWTTLTQCAIDILEVALEETDERVVDLGTLYQQDNHEMVVTIEQEATYTRDAWSFAMDPIRELQLQIKGSDDRLTRFRERVRALERRDGPLDTSSSC